MHSTLYLALFTCVILPHVRVFAGNVVICMTVCNDRGVEAIVSIKSALLVSKPYNQYFFHIFTDESEGVRQSLAPLRTLSKETGETKLNNIFFYFHTLQQHSNLTYVRNFVETLRYEVPRLSVGRRYRCAMDKVVIPALFQKLIVVDTDTLWLEDPYNLMKQIDDFNSENTLGLAREVEGKIRAGWYHKRDQRGRPFYGLNGLNSGVVIYRIDKPDSYLEHMKDLLVRYKDNMPTVDQDLINAYAEKFPKQLHLLSCQWNRRHYSGCYSKQVAGIVHGTGRLFFKVSTNPTRKKQSRRNMEWPPRIRQSWVTRLPYLRAYQIVEAIPFHGL
ncbi:glycosyltransferase family 8 protein [Pseudoscourfieldia marina]